MTDHSTTESVMNLSHRTVERVKLSASLAISLESTLEAAEDVVESDTTLAGRRMIPPMQTLKPLRLHRRATLAAEGRPSPLELNALLGPAAEIMFRWRLERA